MLVLFLALGMPPGNSAAPNFTWTTQYSATLSWTNPFPRYLPGLWEGLGGHDFFFYGPLPFWIIAVVVAPLCPDCSASTEFVLGFAIIFLTSGMAMFAFLRAFFAIGPAVAGALLYMVLPYHLLIDWFERQAASEFAAYSFIPLVALGIEHIRRNGGPGWSLTLGVAGMALSHLPTTLLAAHVFGLVALVLFLSDGRSLGAAVRALLHCAGFAALGLALAAFYWLPAVVLLQTVSPSVLFDPFFEAWRWLYGSPFAHPGSGIALKVLACFLVCLPLLLAAAATARGPVLVLILVPPLFAVLMNTALTEPIWREWIIAKVQFPWRLMIFVDFSAALACVALVAGATRPLARLVAALALVAAFVPAALLAGHITYRTPGATAETLYFDWFGAVEYFSPEMSQALQTRTGKPDLGHFDQVTIGEALPGLVAEFRQTRMNGTILERGPRSLLVAPPQGAEVLSLPVQYWFLWTAETADGTPLETVADPSFGTLGILAPPGGFTGAPVTVSLPAHASEIAGWAVTFLALLGLLAARGSQALRRGGTG